MLSEALLRLFLQAHRFYKVISNAFFVYRCTRRLIQRRLAQHVLVAATAGSKVGIVCCGSLPIISVKLLHINFRSQ